MASESWYVKNECVSVDKLQPLWFLVVSYTIQLIIGFVIISKGVTDLTPIRSSDATKSDRTQTAGDNQETGSQSKLSLILESIKHKLIPLYTKCEPIIKPIRLILKIWSIISFVAIMIFDISDMVQWIQQHPENTGWHRFMCMGCIIFTSSNWKKFVFFFVTLPKLFVFCDCDMDEFEFECDTSQMKKELSLFIFSIIYFLYVVMIMAWFYVIILPSLFIVAWPIFLVYFAMLYIGVKFANAAEKEDATLFVKIGQWVVFVFIVLMVGGFFAFYSAFGLMTVNIYSGMNYWDSWYWVFEERKTDQYLSHAIGQISSAKEKFTFLTWIF